MGNEWELQDTKSTLIDVCLCGHGGYYKIEKEYIDDYARNHNKIDYSIECRNCNEKYEYYKQYWITKENYKNVKNKEDEIRELENELYKELFDKYIDDVLSKFKSKKELYNFCYENKLFGIRCTLNTFYKNGVEQYINSKYGWNIEHLIKLIKHKIQLEQSEDKKYEEIEVKRQELSTYIKGVSVK